MRINKRMSELGLASRRESDALISAGKVLVNGVPAKLGMQVTETDTIELAGARKKYRTYAYYKPTGVITHSPGPDEVDIAMAIKTAHGITDVSPIGRLDKASEGLIILSNDGLLTKRITQPDTDIEKEYVVTVDKPITKHFIYKCEHGVDIEGYITKPAQATKQSDTKFSLVLTEGKKHQIRRMCAALGYQVKSLKRVRIGNVTVGSLKSGAIKQIKSSDV